MAFTKLTFELDGKTFYAVPPVKFASCEGCAFDRPSGVDSRCGRAPSCSPYSTDGEERIFKECGDPALWGDPIVADEPVVPANVAAEPPPATSTAGQKHDQAKPRMDLLDRRFLEGVARVLGFGAKKYAAHNWRGGIELSRLLAAAMRHLHAFNDGENLDPESGECHLYHAGCCLMFASNMFETRPDLDDRYAAPPKS